jgi:ribosomal protein S21|tara:strand:- start:19 stop:213 length:195 start_codon:yes stop_codon:yes gene_type:complete
MALYVVNKGNEGIESMLKRFKRVLKDEGRFIEMRKQDFFVKPSELKRKKRRRKKFVDGTDIMEK